MPNISNRADVMDSRDVIERLEELETDLQDAYEARGDRPDLSFDDWLAEVASDNAHTLQDAAAEYLPLKAFADEASQYSEDWIHGTTIIADSYFDTYAEELADDIGAINREATWPANHIDWAAAADDLKQDYTSVDFDGVTYWVR